MGLSPQYPFFGTERRWDRSQRPAGGAVAMAAIKGDGESESWLRQKANVARIFTEFQEQDTHLSVSWELLSASVRCDRPIYERFAHFLVHVYVIPKGVKNAGLSLGGQSVLNYLGSLINRAATNQVPPSRHARHQGVLLLPGVQVRQCLNQVAAEAEAEDYQADL